MCSSCYILIQGVLHVDLFSVSFASLLQSRLMAGTLRILIITLFIQIVYCYVISGPFGGDYLPRRNDRFPGGIETFPNIQSRPRKRDFRTIQPVGSKLTFAINSSSNSTSRFIHNAATTMAVNFTGGQPQQAEFIDGMEFLVACEAPLTVNVNVRQGVDFGTLPANMATLNNFMWTVNTSAPFMKIDARMTVPCMYRLEDILTVSF